MGRNAALGGLTGFLGGVIAVGDMPNDLPMLQWAGWSVAVANAHADVLKACDARTTSNNDDGVAELLEQLAACGYAMPRRRA